MKIASSGVDYSVTRSLRSLLQLFYMPATGMSQMKAHYLKMGLGNRDTITSLQLRKLRGGSLGVGIKIELKNRHL